MSRILSKRRRTLCTNPRKVLLSVGSNYSASCASLNSTFQRKVKHILANNKILARALANSQLNVAYRDKLISDMRKTITDMEMKRKSVLNSVKAICNPLVTSVSLIKDLMNQLDPDDNTVEDISNISNQAMSLGLNGSQHSTILARGQKYPGAMESIVEEESVDNTQLIKVPETVPEEFKIPHVPVQIPLKAAEAPIPTKTILVPHKIADSSCREEVDMELTTVLSTTLILNEARNEKEPEICQVIAMETQKQPSPKKAQRRSILKRTSEVVMDKSNSQVNFAEPEKSTVEKNAAKGSMIPVQQRAKAPLSKSRKSEQNLKKIEEIAGKKKKSDVSKPEELKTSTKAMPKSKKDSSKLAKNVTESKAKTTPQSKRKSSVAHEEEELINPKKRLTFTVQTPKVPEQTKEQKGNELFKGEANQEKKVEASNVYDQTYIAEEPVDKIAMVEEVTEEDKRMPDIAKEKVEILQVPLAAETVVEAKDTQADLKKAAVVGEPKKKNKKVLAPKENQNLDEKSSKIMEKVFLKAEKDVLQPEAPKPNSLLSKDDLPEAAKQHNLEADKDNEMDLNNKAVVEEPKRKKKQNIPTPKKQQNHLDSTIIEKKSSKNTKETPTHNFFSTSTKKPKTKKQIPAITAKSKSKAKKAKTKEMDVSLNGSIVSRVPVVSVFDITSEITQTILPYIPAAPVEPKSKVSEAMEVNEDVLGEVISLSDDSNVELHTRPNKIAKVLDETLYNLEPETSKRKRSASKENVFEVPKPPGRQTKKSIVVKVEPVDEVDRAIIARSSRSSVASDFSDVMSSKRSTRGSRVNYKEPSLGKKLRRGDDVGGYKRDSMPLKNLNQDLDSSFT